MQIQMLIHSEDNEYTFLNDFLKNENWYRLQLHIFQQHNCIIQYNLSS